MIKIFEIYQTIGFFNLLWIVCLMLIFVASFRTWGEDYVWIFGFFIFYIIFFPLYKRWDRYFNDILISWPSFWVSIFILILLSIFWIILLFKLLPEISYFLYKNNLVKDSTLQNKFIQWLMQPHVNEESKRKKWLKNFSAIWSSWVPLISNNLPSTVVIFEFLVKNIPKYLDTKTKILWFFGLTIYLPRFLTLVALFYDIYIENQYYWFPKIGLLLTVSVLTRMCLTYVENPARECMDHLTSILTYDIPEKEKIPEEMYEYAKAYSKTAFIATFKLREEFKEEYDYNLVFEQYILYTNILQWFDFANEFVSIVFSKILLVFLTAQIIVQIKIILKYYDNE